MWKTTPFQNSPTTPFKPPRGRPPRIWPIKSHYLNTEKVGAKGTDLLECLLVSFRGMKVICVERTSVELNPHISVKINHCCLLIFLQHHCCSFMQPWEQLTVTAMHVCAQVFLLCARSWSPTQTAAYRFFNQDWTDADDEIMLTEIFNQNLHFRLKIQTDLQLLKLITRKMYFSAFARAYSKQLFYLIPPLIYIWFWI